MSTSYQSKTLTITETFTHTITLFKNMKKTKHRGAYQNQTIFIGVYTYLNKELRLYTMPKGF